MASINLTLEVPEAAVPLVRRTLGAQLGEEPPTTLANTKSAIERYLKSKLKSDATQQKQAEAQAAAAIDDSDGAVSW